MEPTDPPEPDPGPPPESDAALPPDVVRGFFVCAFGFMFVGMAAWVLALDPNAGSKAAWHGWRLRDAVLTLFAAYSLRKTAQHVWAVLLYQREARGHPALPQLTQNLGSGAWQVLACVVAVGAFALAPYGLPADALGLVPAAGNWLAIGAAVGLVAGPGAVVLFVAMSKFARESMRIEGAQADFVAPQGGPRPPRLAVAGMILVGVVLAPVAEELLFRGVVYPGLRAGLGVWPAVFFSALLFGLAHGDHGRPAVVFTTVMGAAFAVLVERGGSLWPAVLAHVLVNSKLVLMYLGAFRGPA